MIQIIAGKKGSGKTKRLIDMTNNAVKTSSGNVVFLDKNDSYMYEVDRAVRFVNVEEYSVSSAEMFLGFLGGVEVDAVVLAGELGAACAVDDHGIAVADERRVLPGRRFTAGGVCCDGQRFPVGDDDDLALRIGAVNFRVQRLQTCQHVRAWVTVVIVRSDADHRHRGLHSRQERLG